jgi:NAD(P)-dependent dehydrogenase (short-subunit alcohol dehydrogenase family)
MRLQGRKALITGAGSGIGAATTQLFTEHGAEVFAVDIPDGRLAECHGDNPAVHCLGLDLTDEGAAETIIDAVMGTMGGLDIVMNNAGLGAFAMIEDTTDALWDKIMDVNLNVPFKICRLATPHLKQSGHGRIINVASVMAKKADTGLTAYGASKAGITGMTRNLALELGRHAITVNNILPGAIVTGMTAQSFENDNVAEIWAHKSPLRRLGQPLDIAHGALFLASDESSFVTGHDFHIDGGMLLKQ